MKKFFTLIAGMLIVSSGAFAQTKWTNLVINGDMEGTQDPIVDTGSLVESIYLKEKINKREKRPFP